MLLLLPLVLAVMWDTERLQGNSILLKRVNYINYGSK